MNVTIFVDTNVLVYARDNATGDKHRRAAEWMRRLWQEQSGRLSMQVLHEYYVTVTAKLKPGRSRAEAREDVRQLCAWRPVSADEQTLFHAWEVSDRYKIEFRDSLVVAAAIRSGANYLLTEDLQDEQELAGLRVINPFTHAVDSL